MEKFDILFAKVIQLKSKSLKINEALGVKHGELVVLVQPCCLQAIEQYNKTDREFKIVSEKFNLNFNLKENTVEFDIHLTDKKGTEPDEELSDEDVAISEELGQILNSIFSKAAIRLTLKKIHVPHWYFGK